MILLLDNFDSFTYNLVDYFEQLGITPHVMRNNQSLSNIKKHDYEGIVLSPGPETPHTAGNIMQVIDYYHQHLPILGICLGHQALGAYFGGMVAKAIKPMHGKLSTMEFSRDPIFKNLKSPINVVRYHSLIVKDLPEDAFNIIGETADNEIMAIKHKKWPSYGLQYHPEAALTDNGLQTLENWRNIYGIGKQ